MAITQSALAHAVARDFLRAAPPEAGIKRVWVWSQHGYIDPERDYVELTILAAPATEDALDIASAALHEQYQDINILIRTVTLHDLGGRDFGGELRSDAEEIVLGH